ncbi:cyclase family protein [Micromonospora zamorensis]
MSRYDDRGPAWYWKDFSTGEHTGAHFDAPVHWVSGQQGGAGTVSVVWS